MVGVGHPFEAITPIDHRLPAGAYHLVADGMASGSPRVRFDVIFCHAGVDHVVASFTHRYDAPLSQYEDTAMAPAIDAVPGDHLVFHASLVTDGGQSSASYVPVTENPGPTARWLTLDVPH